MNLVVLDGYTLNPGDLDWSALHQLATPGGRCGIHDRTPPRLILERAHGAEVVLTNKTPLDHATLASLRPTLRYVGVLATGYNVVDTDAARQLGITVTNIPTYGTMTVAQATVALLLELTNHTGAHARDTQSGRWSRAADWTYWDQPPVELDGLRLGLVGFGKIAQAVARIGQAFGMEIVTHRRNPERASEVPGVRCVELDELFAASDVVSLHCPLTDATRGLVNHNRLVKMKPTALLLNTARGPLIVEADLAEALNADRLAGAGLDVLCVEPPAADNPLLSAKHCIVTPHVAWASRAARSRLLDTAVANVRAFLAGQPQNVVN